MAASISAISNAEQAAQVAQQAQNSLTRATQAVQAMMAVQNAARAAAQGVPHSNTLNLNVPNGLAPGGLVPNMAAGWSGANAPTQSTSDGQTVVGIQQTAPQAILNWQTFNVGAQTTVNFNQQGNSNWVALNRIAAAGTPSQILGSIRADGQVYLINPNGIIFGGASQINVGALVASSAGITDSQFLTAGIYSTQSGSTYNPSFTNAGGPIIVEPGALITTSTPSSVTSGGGFVLMMGTQVQNAGTIVTPDGQTELAAGDNFLIRAGYSTTANSWSTTRGNEIAPQLNVLGSSLAGGSGLVRNDGYVEADTGDVTLAGETVVQNGVLISTTSVNVRGTIHLLSSDSDPYGSVTLTGNSFAGILPDDSGATALDNQRASLIADSATQDINRSNDVSIQPGGQFDDLSPLSDLEDESRIEIVSGGTVEFQNGSLTLANGGQVAVSATQRVQVDSNAIIDVSGLVNVPLPMSANQIAVDVEGNELRDDPNNRDNRYAVQRHRLYRRSQSDLRPGRHRRRQQRPRLYVRGGVRSIGMACQCPAHDWGVDVGRRLDYAFDRRQWIGGGAIRLRLQHLRRLGSVPERLSQCDLSARQQRPALHRRYCAGRSDLHDLQWLHRRSFALGVTDIYWDPLKPRQVYEPGYIVGRDAGNLILSTPTSVFDGNIEAGVIEGAEQTSARPATVGDPYLLSQTTVPLAGSVDLGEYNALGLFGGYDTVVTFGAGSADVAGSLTVADPVPNAATDTAYFNASQISAPISVVCRLPRPAPSPSMRRSRWHPGAHVSFVAPDVDIAANLTLRGGTVSISNIYGASNSPQVLTDANGLAQFTLEAGAIINTQGLWTNGLLDPSNLSGLAFINGGAVSIDMTQGAALESGSVINTSSGGAILYNGKTEGGASGNITLIADDQVGGGSSTAPLVLDGTLAAYGITKGGALTLTAPSVLIGDSVAATAPGQLVLGSAFFSQGFSSYDITGDQGLAVADGTQLIVTEPVYQFTAASFAVPTGSDPGVALTPWTPPLYLANPLTAQLIQRPSASLSLNGAGESGLGGPVTIGAGARIAVDPGQSITVIGNQQITVDGTLQAPSGAVSILGGSATQNSAGLDQSIWIGDGAVLDVSARAATALDQFGQPYGVVPAGGSIVLGAAGDVFNAGNGIINSTSDFIVVRSGAVLDASGASALIDPQAGSFPSLLRPATTSGPILVASNGGSIS